MTNKHQQKQIASTILIPYGVVENTPEPFTTEKGIVITFKPTDKNKLHVNFDFTNTNLTQKEGLIFAKDKTNDIAHSISLQHTLNTQTISTHMVVWGNGVSSERNSSVSGKAAIVLPINIANEFSIGLSKHGMSLDFFSKALRYKEMSGKDREVGFWLYFSYEALLTELYDKKRGAEKKLKEHLNKVGVLNANKFNAYKNSVGRYYRHFESSYNGETLSIESCVDLHQSILRYFVELAE